MDNPTQDQKRADLARAMGWIIAEVDEQYCDPTWKIAIGNTEIINFSDYESARDALPNPYESADDSRALVAWLATLPRDKQHQFELDLRCEMNIKLPYALAVLTLDLPIIADAAWQAIQEKQ